MKKNNKKGFTIVELVIVIAVIAILAAVLIPTFSSVIKKAKVNNDIQLVRNLNTALAADTKEHKTMQAALDAAFEFGYDVAKINNTSVEENEILWDSVNDVFCYLKDGALEYVPNSATTVLEATDYRLWKISDTVDETYSTYYVGSAATIETTKGFDAGTTTGITEIKYVNNAEGATAQNVVIRTNGGKLTIDAENDTIHHYGDIENLKITAVDTNSYHEYGKVGFVSIAKGRFVSEANSKVIALLSTGADVVISQASQGSIVAAYTTVANNNTNGNTTLTLKEAYADENNTELKDIIYNAEAQVINAISVNGKYYKTMSEAFDKVVKVNGDGYQLDKDITIILYKDIEDKGLVINSGIKVIIDLNGHNYILNGAVGSVGTASNGIQILGDSNVVIKNGTISCSENNKISGQAIGANVQRLIQDYGYLTLTDVTIDARNQFGSPSYCMSFNNKPVLINGNTSVILRDKNVVAFDADGNWGGYDRARVTIDTTGTIDGYIEVGNGYFDIKNVGSVKGIRFCSSCGTGETTDQHLRVTKVSSVNIPAPYGYSWNEDGTGLIKN
ncbi:MAG: type II secretion system GspH family protein [Clostridiales bacterium]|nr:type II secretion system GspH family protein [Clostridiales bacterium]